MEAREIVSPTPLIIVRGSTARLIFDHVSPTYSLTQDLLSAIRLSVEKKSEEIFRADRPQSKDIELLDTLWDIEISKDLNTSK